MEIFPPRQTERHCVSPAGAEGKRVEQGKLHNDKVSKKSLEVLGRYAIALLIRPVHKPRKAGGTVTSGFEASP